MMLIQKMLMRCSLILLVVSLLPGVSMATVQIQSLGRLKGAETNTLVGMGLVVGLNGTGDSGKSFQTSIKSLATVVERYVDPSVVAAELQGSKSVALVAIEANLPATGVRDGDRVNLKVSVVGNAKSLKGGRLLMVPLTGPLPNSPVYAFGHGDVELEDADSPTSGVVTDGAQLTRDIVTNHFDAYGRITFVIEQNASWPTATNIAELINGVISPAGPKLAKAISPQNVIIDVPVYERDDPSTFIKQILTTPIDLDFIEGESMVRINERTGTIIIDGDVEISPCLISHGGLILTTVSTARPPQQAAAAGGTTETEQRFLKMNPTRRSAAKLSDLMAAFNQLEVDAKDRIAIIKELHRSKNLHAKLVVGH